MCPGPTNVPAQLLPDVVAAGFVLIPAATHAYGYPASPTINVPNNNNGGWTTHLRTASSWLTAHPLQISLWAAYTTLPAFDPVVLAWDIRLKVTHVSLGTWVSYDSTAYSVFPRVPIQKPASHFLSSDPAGLTRFAFPANTLNRGDLFNVTMYTQITDPFNNFVQRRGFMAGLFYWFTDEDLKF